MAPYDYELTLRRVDRTSWVILSNKGIELYNITSCPSREAAVVEAEAWASSWSSVRIEVQDGISKC